MDQAAIGDFGGDSNRLDVYLDILAAIFDDSFQPVRFLRRERTRGAGEDKFSICFRGNARRLRPYSGGTSSVSASGTMQISAGRRPANSPSICT